MANQRAPIWRRSETQVPPVGNLHGAGCSSLHRPGMVMVSLGVV